jgi:hypothetical protein
MASAEQSFSVAPWRLGPICPECRVPLVMAVELGRSEESFGLPLGCPACGKACDGTLEQIAAVEASSRIYGAHRAELEAVDLRDKRVHDEVAERALRRSRRAGR